MLEKIFGPKCPRCGVRLSKQDEQCPQCHVELGANPAVNQAVSHVANQTINMVDNRWMAAPDELAVFFMSRDLRGTFAKPLRVPTGMVAYIMQGEQWLAFPPGEYTLENLSERLNSFFQGQYAEILIVREAALPIEFSYADILCKDGTRMALQSTIYLKVGEIKDLRNHFMQSTGVISVGQIGQVLYGPVKQVLQEIIGQYKPTDLPDHANLREQFNFALKTGLQHRCENLGLVIDNADTLQWQHEKMASWQEAGELQHRALEQEQHQHELEKQRRQNQDELELARLRIQLEQARIRNEQEFNDVKSKLEQTRLQEQDLPQRAMTAIQIQQLLQTMLRNNAIKEAELQAEKEKKHDERVNERDSKQQTLKLKEKDAEHQQWMARFNAENDRIDVLGMQPLETLILQADTPAKVNALAQISIANYAKNNGLTPEQIREIGQILHGTGPVAATIEPEKPPPSTTRTTTNAAAHAQTIGVEPLNFEWFASAWLHRTDLALKFINQNSQTIAGALVDDDFKLHLETQFDGHILIFAEFNSGEFRQLAPNRASQLNRGQAVAKAEYCLPGDLLPLPVEELGPEIDRMYFDSAGTERILAFCVPDPLPACISTALALDNILAQQTMQTILRELTKRSDAAMAFARIKVHAV